MLAGLLAGAPATAKKHHHHRDWCPKTLKHCPLKLTRPHGLIPGLNEDWQVRRDDLGYASNTGALTIRFPLTWATVQPRNENVWDWSSL